MSTAITLPANVTVDRVANVLGILHGCQASKRTLDKSSWYTDVAGVVTLGLPNMPSCANIYISPSGKKLKLVDGRWKGAEDSIRVLFHFEWEGKKGFTLPKTKANMRIAMQVVDFFGGSVDFDDGDDHESDYIVPEKFNEENCPEEGEPWEVFQQKTYNLYLQQEATK